MRLPLLAQHLNVHGGVESTKDLLPLLPCPLIAGVDRAGLPVRPVERVPRERQGKGVSEAALYHLLPAADGKRAEWSEEDLIDQLCPILEAPGLQQTPSKESSYEHTRLTPLTPSVPPGMRGHCPHTAKLPGLWQKHKCPWTKGQMPPTEDKQLLESLDPQPCCANSFMLIQSDVLYPEATSTAGKHSPSSVLRISHTVDIIFNEIMNTGNRSGTEHSQQLTIA